MLAPRTRKLRSSLLAVAALLALVSACSTDSPTAPSQQPAPPPGTSPVNATWNITIEFSPPSITAGSSQPVTVSVRVRRADNGQLPQAFCCRKDISGKWPGFVHIALPT